jgi:hypothetical protein
VDRKVRGGGITNQIIDQPEVEGRPFLSEDMVPIGSGCARERVESEQKVPMMRRSDIPVWVKEPDVFFENKGIDKFAKIFGGIVGLYRVFQEGVASADGLNWAPNHTHPCMHGSFLWIMY